MACAAAQPLARYPDTLLAQRLQRSFSLSDFTLSRNGALGSGRFGTVHKVVETRSRCALVLKKVCKKALVEEDAVRQFQREVEIHSRLRHPHIVRMYAYFHDAASCYLLLELAELGNLYAKIMAGRLAEREAACIFRQLVSAVAHMHRRGVIHRDIKPENVFLGRGAGDEVRGSSPTALPLSGWQPALETRNTRTHTHTLTHTCASHAHSRLW